MWVVEKSFTILRVLPVPHPGLSKIKTLFNICVHAKECMADLTLIKFWVGVGGNGVHFLMC